MTQTSEPYSTTTTITAATTESRGHRWFIVAATLGFLGLLFTKHYYHTGRGVIACSLWQYYLMEAGNGFPSLRNAIGGPQNAVIATVLIHLGLSVLIGLIASSVRWFARWRRKGTSTQD